jgi:hypothetical protein
MTSHPRRRLAALLAVAGVVAGCGQGSSTTVPSGSPKGATSLARSLVAAASRTTAAGTARVAMTMTIGTPQGDMHARVTGLMAFHPPRRGVLSMAMRIPGATSEIAMQERMVGTVLYMRAPALTSRIPGGRPWLKLDLGALGRQQGVDLGALMNASNNDPSQFLGYLRGITNGVQQAGPATVDGVATTHYRASIDVRKAAAHFPPNLRRQYMRIVDQMGTSSLPVEVWVGRDGLLRQERLHMDMPSVGGSMTILMRLSDFGVPVHVTAPPAGETTDLAKLLASAGGTA